jgi:hypothetical protein
MTKILYIALILTIAVSLAASFIVPVQADSEIGGYVKVEPTGVCNRNGLLQVRFSFYLYSSDYGYNKTHVQIPVIPESGYTGAVDASGTATNSAKYQAWENSLPKVWQDTPFYNHFVYADPEISDSELMDIGQQYLKQAYSQWETGQTPHLSNTKVNYPATISSSRLAAINSKIAHLSNTVLRVDNILDR